MSLLGVLVLIGGVAYAVAARRSHDREREQARSERDRIGELRRERRAQLEIELAQTPPPSSGSSTPRATGCHSFCA